MFSLLASLAGVLVMLITAPALVGYIQVGRDQAKAAAAAGHMRLFNQAIQAYVKQNYATIQGMTPVAITPTTLQSAGYLPTGWINRNPYGQSYQAYVTQPSPGNLEVAVTTQGGVQIPEQNAALVAALVGQEGGYTSFGTTAPAGWLEGAFGGWAVNASTVTNSFPGPGHLASLLYLGGGSALSPDYLYRVSVPGHPELNTMQTDENMGGNDLVNAAAVGVGTSAPSFPLDISKAVNNGVGILANFKNTGTGGTLYQSRIQVQGTPGSNYEADYGVTDSTTAHFNGNPGAFVGLNNGTPWFVAHNNMPIGVPELSVSPSGQVAAGGNLTVNTGGQAASPIIDIREPNAGPWAMRFFRNDLGGGPQLFASTKNTLFEQGALSVNSQSTSESGLSVTAPNGISGADVAMFRANAGNSSSYWLIDAQNGGSSEFYVRGDASTRVTGPAAEYSFGDRDNSGSINSLYGFQGAARLWSSANGGDTVLFPHNGNGFGIQTTGANGGAIGSSGGSSGFYASERNGSGVQHYFYGNFGLGVVGNSETGDTVYFPDRGNYAIQSTGTAGNGGGILSQGSSGGFYAVDQDAAVTNAMYGLGGQLRLWNTSFGDTVAFPHSGNMVLAAAATNGNACPAYGYIGIDTAGSGVLYCGTDLKWHSPGAKSLWNCTQFRGSGPGTLFNMSTSLNLPSGNWVIWGSWDFIGDQNVPANSTVRALGNMHDPNWVWAEINCSKSNPTGTGFSMQDASCGNAGERPDIVSGPTQYTATATLNTNSNFTPNGSGPLSHVCLAAFPTT